jgi:hypothetical protein
MDKIHVVDRHELANCKCFASVLQLSLRLKNQLFMYRFDIGDEFADMVLANRTMGIFACFGIAAVVLRADLPRYMESI